MEPQDRQRSIEVAFPSSPEYLSLLRAVVGWVCERSGFDERERSRIALAVVEAVTNIIRHAYGGDPAQRIELCLGETAQGLEIEILDRGRSVSPREIASRDPEELEPGGLGVHVMKSCMDGFHYEARPGGGSRLVLRKLRRPQAGAEGRQGQAGAGD